MNDQEKVTQEELENALRSMALLIQEYGPKYWPIFERLDEELKRVKARQRRLSVALGF